MTHPDDYVFQINPQHHSLSIHRSFDAPASWLWKAWTQPSILEQWFGPMPFKVQTLESNFSAGGEWIYQLDAPEYGPQWGRTAYHLIEPERRFTASDCFLGEDLQPLEGMPVSQWEIQFEDLGSKSAFDLETKYQSAEDLAIMIQGGYRDGFESVMGNLDRLIQTNPALFQR